MRAPAFGARRGRVFGAWSLWFWSTVTSEVLGKAAEDGFAMSPQPAITTTVLQSSNDPLIGLTKTHDTPAARAEAKARAGYQAVDPGRAMPEF